MFRVQSFIPFLSGIFDAKSLSTQFIACRPMGMCIATDPTSGDEITGTYPCHTDVHCFENSVVDGKTVQTPAVDSKGMTTTGVCNIMYENPFLGKLHLFSISSWILALKTKNPNTCSHLFLCQCFLILLCQMQ